MRGVHCTRRLHLEGYFQQESGRFYRIAHGILRHREDALDAVQNAMIRAFQKSETLRNEGFLQSWFYRILVNECYAIARSRRRLPQFAELEIIDAAETDSRPTDPGNDIVTRALNALNPEQRTLIVLRYFEELKLEDIAVATGQNLNTLKTRLYKTLKLLRTLVKKEREQ